MWPCRRPHASHVAAPHTRCTCDLAQPTPQLLPPRSTTACGPESCHRFHRRVRSKNTGAGVTTRRDSRQHDSRRMLRRSRHAAHEQDHTRCTIRSDPLLAQCRRRPNWRNCKSFRLRSRWRQGVDWPHSLLAPIVVCVRLYSRVQSALSPCFVLDLERVRAALAGTAGGIRT